MLRSIAFRACVLASFVALALVALLGALAYSTRQTREAFDWVDHTQQVLLAVDRTTGALRTAESGQRGFILTGDNAFVTDFPAQLEAARRSATEVERLTADNRAQHARALSLVARVGQRTGWLAINLDRARAGRFAAATEGVRSGKGRALMDAIEVEAGRIRGEEHRLMSEREARFDRLVSSTGLLLWVGGPMLVLLLGGFVALSVRQVGRPTRAILEGMTRLAAGDDNATIAPRQGSAEFDRLALGYNAMVRRLAANDVERRDADAKLQTSNADLAATAKDAARRGAAIERLAGMAHRMQAARNDGEMALVIGCFAPQVLPGTAGRLYAFNNSRNSLVPVAAWGGCELDDDGFAPEACWALRRGQSHAVPEAGVDVICDHMAQAGDARGVPYHCEPLLAGGDVVGLLQLDGAIHDDERFMLNALAENIASSLVNHRLQRGLREQTIRDPLTALYNRRFMEETLSTEVARATRSRTPLALVMCDVDHFKRFNDEFGHNAGDAVLQAVGAEMARHFRDGDVVCRYGGEEFAIIAPGGTPAAIEARVERLREAIARLVVRDGPRALGSVSMSFGLAEFDAALDADAAALIQRADMALYRAKREGRNRIALAA